MPRPDQKSVTLCKDIYEIAKKSAKEHNPPKSVAGYITDLVLRNTRKEPH